MRTRLPSAARCPRGSGLKLRAFHQKLHLALALPFVHIEAEGQQHAGGQLGAQAARALAVPGHTPACLAYQVGDAVFVGDTIFMPDYGTARADFPGGDAAALYRSIRRLLSLPPETRLFMCHDYKAPGRDSFAWETTVAEQRARNVHVHDGVDEAAFVALRRKRDAGLSAPVLLLPSVQVNIRAGHLPPADPNGVSYLRIPVRLAG